jgi:hypothetical protein
MLFEMQRDLLDDPAFGNLRLAGRLQAERDGFKNILAGFFQTVALGDASRERGNVDCVAAFIRRFENNLKLHIQSYRDYHRGKIQLCNLYLHTLKFYSESRRR